jgi:hypothetical protein
MLSLMDVTPVTKSEKFLLGTGYGIVRFDVNAKVTDKDSGRSRYIDLEGNLGLEKRSSVRNIYGSYRISDKHSIQFAYFDINRSSTFISIDESYGDLLAINASVEVKDTSGFYNLSYGYQLFKDINSMITLIVGLNGIDLRFSAEARGEITVGNQSRSEAIIAEADAFAPLPLLGLHFITAFTPEWSIATRVSLVAGTYEDVTAGILQANIFSRYQFSKHVGLLLGLTYFSADIDVEDNDELIEVSYGYDGIFVGLQFGL